MRKIEFSFSEVDASLGLWEMLAWSGFAALVCSAPFIFKAFLLALGV